MIFSSLRIQWVIIYRLIESVTVGWRVRVNKCLYVNKTYDLALALVRLWV